MAKRIIADSEARKRVLEGAEELYSAVKVTMGPKGRNVVISKSYGGPTVTHDGVTVAKAVEIDQSKDDDSLGRAVGAELVRSAASKMNDVAGDGTTTTTVLTYHILNEANKLITAGHNPMDLKKGLDHAGAQVVAQIDKLAEQIAGSTEKVAQVATISAGDAEIGALIADVIESVGNDGVVTVEQSQTLGMEKEIVEGFKIDRGYVSPYLVTDKARLEATYENPYILITDKKISSLKEIIPVIETVAKAGKKELVIIAEDVDGEALAGLVLNHLQGAFKSVAIKAPSFGDRRKAILEDIAILTGGTVVSDEVGVTFETVTLDMLGRARKVIATKDSSTIIEGAGAAQDVTERITQIKAQLDNTSSEYERKQIEERLAAVTGKVAVIKVGGATETEIEEKKFRVDDAVAATKAAVAGGIVPGGGVTLVDLSKTLKVEATKVADSQSAGELILKNALVQPFRILMENAGVNADEKLPQVLAASGGQGFNVNDASKLVDLKAQGIIDPAKVTREAVQNAVSIAGTAMTMGALIVDLPEEKPAAAPDMGGMGMGY